MVAVVPPGIVMEISHYCYSSLGLSRPNYDCYLQPGEPLIIILQTYRCYTTYNANISDTENCVPSPAV